MVGVLGEVFRAVARGVPLPRVGAVLGIDDDMAQLCLEHLLRQKLITPASELGLSCLSCDPRNPPPACRTCPLAVTGVGN
jgi:hypothetical protein